MIRRRRERRCAALVARPDLKVNDLTETAKRIGSSLVAVDLAGLTALETGFAWPLMAGAMGLVLALGHIERRRSLAVLRALGAGAGGLGAFLWGEALPGSWALGSLRVSASDFGLRKRWSR